MKEYKYDDEKAQAKIGDTKLRLKNKRKLQQILVLEEQVKNSQLDEEIIEDREENDKNLPVDLNGDV